MIAKRHIPNVLTASRVVLAAGFFALLAAEPPAQAGVRAATPHVPTLLAAGIFALAAITDALDGFLARRWNAISRFGRIMDPFADKLLVLGAFVMLAGPGFFVADGGGVLLTRAEPWMVVVILARELLVTSLRGVLEAGGADFSASASGKAKMVLQSVTVPVALVAAGMGEVGPGSPLGRALSGLMWTTTLVSALSGLPYVRRAITLSARSERSP